MISRKENACSTGSWKRRDFLRVGSLAPLAMGVAGHLLDSPTAFAAPRKILQQVMTASDTPIGKLQHGVGFNWADSFEKDRSASPVFPALNDQAGWAALTQALDDLRPGIIRFALPPNPCVGDKPGEIKSDNNRIKRLLRIAAWAEKNGCTLMVDPFFVPKKYQFDMGPKELERKKTQQFLEMAAKDNVAYAREFIVPLLKYLLVEQDLRAVKLFNAYNEPLMYGPFTTPNNQPDAFLHYVDMYKAINSELKKAGLYPEKIRLAGVDCIEPNTFPVLDFLARGVDIDPYIDVYTIHYYDNRLDWMPPGPMLPHPLEESIDGQTSKLVKYCKQRGKPLLAAEVGWYSDDFEPDIEAQSRHQAALVNAELMVRGMNAGLSGFAMWVLMGGRGWGVFSVRDGRYYPTEHPYPMYRLFSRYARPGSEVFPLKPEDREWPWQYVYGTSLLTPEGKAVVYLVNDHLTESRKVKLQLPGNFAGRKLRKVIKDSVRLGNEAGSVEPTASGQSAVMEDLLTPMSLTAYLEEV